MSRRLGLLERILGELNRLGEVMAAGDITRLQRDKLLARMTDELADHVLMDNYRQSMALTHCEFDPEGLLDESIRFMRAWNRPGGLIGAWSSCPMTKPLKNAAPPTSA